MPESIVTNSKVGPNVTAEAREQVSSTLATAVAAGILIDGVRMVDGGMEDLSSPYLVLATSAGTKLLVLERRDDDGEYAAQAYLCPLTRTGETRTALWQATAGFTDKVTGLDPGALEVAGLLSQRSQSANDATLDLLLSSLLFGFRDTLASTTAPPSAE
jgi:hypothetical protein